MKNKKGFTLLEILLVVAAMSILASIVIVAINPSKQLGDTRNAQRYSDVSTIMNAVYQYAIDSDGDISALNINNTDTAGVLPQVLGTAPPATDCSGVCTKLGGAGATDADCLDIGAGLLVEDYIVDMPQDPRSGTAAITGYYIERNDNGRITVGACEPEQDKTISVRR